MARHESISQKYYIVLKILRIKISEIKYQHSTVLDQIIKVVSGFST